MVNALAGRISPDKRPDRTLLLRVLPASHLKFAAKVEHVDEAYFGEVNAPLLEETEIECVGEIKRAPRLSFSVERPDCFSDRLAGALRTGHDRGHGVRNASACLRCGSVLEIVEDRLTGRIVSNLDEAVQAIPELLVRNVSPHCAWHRTTWSFTAASSAGTLRRKSGFRLLPPRRRRPERERIVAKRVCGTNP